ncbi:MAG: hypothetical protein FJ128_11350 [Deltaproteobacteria bacterium]|nr:hypothetical protein [Deltaproteobacteria bacterium]
MSYLRDAEGNVYLEADNPRAAWTAQEWEALKAAKQAEVEVARQELEALPKPDPTWPPEARAMAASFADVVLGRPSLEAKLAGLEAELAELEKV